MPLPDFFLAVKCSVHAILITPISDFWLAMIYQLCWIMMILSGFLEHWFYSCFGQSQNHTALSTVFNNPGHNNIKHNFCWLVLDRWNGFTSRLCMFMGDGFQIVFPRTWWLQEGENSVIEKECLWVKENPSIILLNSAWLHIRLLNWFRSYIS